MNAKLIDDDLGEVQIRRVRDPRSRIKHESVFKFESKEVREAVKAHAPNLGNLTEMEAGMRFHVPNHLQNYGLSGANVAVIRPQKEAG